MRYLFILPLSFFSNFAGILAQTKIYPAEITIIDESSKPVEGASVQVINTDVNSDWKSSIKVTRETGKVDFLEVPAGKVKIKASKDGYLPIDELEKITENGNIWTYTMKKNPDNRFYLSGRITDRTGEPLAECHVRLKLVGSSARDTTDEDGRFEFIIPEHPLRTQFELDIRRKDYESKSIDGEFYERIRWLRDDIQLDKKVERKKLEPSRLRIGPVGEVNFFLSDLKENGTIVNLSSGILGLYEIDLGQQKFHAGLGWHFPLPLRTTNSFTTLTGFESEIETKYRVKSMGFVVLRYYAHSSSDGPRPRFSPFIGLTTLFVNQQPEDAIFSNGNFTEERTSFLKAVPRLSLGISWKNRLINVEPFLGYSYFRLESQNFVFNYFGRAEPISIKNKFHHLSMGLTCLLTLPKL